MNGALAVAYGLSYVAACEGIARKVVCLCVCCLEEIDPSWSAPAHRAPDGSECERCAVPARWREGFVFAVLPVLA